jgi:predicted Fe-Mo cluster-binding NifX family protein
MKIAIATDDGRTVSSHFGRAEKFVVITIDDGFIILRETLIKANHHDFKHDGLDGQNRSCDDARGKGYDRQSDDNHNRIYETITDCQVVLARSMGRGVYIGLHQMDIQPILTDIRDIDIAVQAVIDGSIKDHPERLH